MKTKIYIAGKITGDPEYKAKFEVAAEADYADFGAYKCRTMLAFADKADSYEKMEALFGVTPKLSHGRIVLVTKEMTSAELDAKLAESGLKVLSRIRLL